MITSWEFEAQARKLGFAQVCGIDEAGRGPLAGPVVAAAVVLPYGENIADLDDSKKLSEKRREALFDRIIDKAIAYGIASVDEKTIDEINILQATYRAMAQAVQQIQADYALVDGNQSEGLSIPYQTIVGGDHKSPSIAAASVLAKVTRDRYMREMAQKYPQYGFDQHKGYGTKLHYQALDAYDACPLHRRSFLKKYYAAKKQ